MSRLSTIALALALAFTGCMSEEEVDRVDTTTQALTAATVQVLRIEAGPTVTIPNANATTSISSTQFTVDATSSVQIVGTVKAQLAACSSTTLSCGGSYYYVSNSMAQASVYNAQGQLVFRSTPAPLSISVVGASSSVVMMPFTIQDTATLTPGAYTLQFEINYWTDTVNRPPNGVRLLAGSAMFVKI